METTENGNTGFLNEPVTHTKGKLIIGILTAFAVGYLLRWAQTK